MSILWVYKTDNSDSDKIEKKTVNNNKKLLSPKTGDLTPMFARKFLSSNF